MMTHERGTGDHRWLGSPVKLHNGPIEEVAKHLPRFGRRPFAVSKSDEGPCGVSTVYDTIVRLGSRNEDPETPVGIVSKNYKLVQHHEILELAIEALKGINVDPSTIAAELTLTEHAERMALCLSLPSEFDYHWCNDGDDPLRLQFLCFNSVEGSTRLSAFLGWYRFVCSNGLIVGTTLGRWRRQHTRGLRTQDLGRILRDGMVAAERERKRYDRWTRDTLDEQELVRWIDGELRRAWGVKAAARALAIATTGRDAELTVPFEGGRPSERTVELGRPVPGSIVPARSPFALCQVLSWLAGQRRDLQDQIAWTAQIPRLVESLVHPN